MSISIAEKFETLTMPVAECGCQIWLGGVSRQGYGVMRLNRKTETTHRIIWRRTFGKIPKGKYVLHRCDVRCCVNPDHLFLGTHLENVQDMMRKGRHVRPPPEFKLFARDCETIAQMYASGESMRSIGRQFGVHHGTISTILKERDWSRRKMRAK